MIDFKKRKRSVMEFGWHLHCNQLNDQSKIQSMSIGVNEEMFQRSVRKSIDCFDWGAFLRPCKYWLIWGYRGAFRLDTVSSRWKDLLLSFFLKPPGVVFKQKVLRYPQTPHHSQVSMKNLQLDRNQLSCLDTNILTTWKELEILTLNGNKLNTMNQIDLANLRVL